jgi:hypothetical protein
MESATEIRERLDAGQRHMFLLLSGITEEQFKRRPTATDDDPRPWCIAEVLAHLLSIERLWAGRIALALAQDGATITPSPPEAHDEGARAGRQVPVPQLIHGLLGVRRDVEKLLEKSRGRDRALLANTLWHPRLQERLDLSWMFAKVAGHAEEHADQVEALRRAVGARPASERQAV